MEGIPDTTEEVEDDDEIPSFLVYPDTSDERKDVVGMYEDITEEFPEEAIREMVESELSSHAAKVIDYLYSNREQITEE